MEIAPYLQNFREQHPIRTSATNFKAQRFNCEETGNFFLPSRVQPPILSLPPKFKFGAYSPSPGFKFGVPVNSSNVAKGITFNFAAVDGSNIDTCSSHSRDPTPRVINTKLPQFGGEEDAADNRLAVILATIRLSIRDAARRSNVSKNTARLLASLSINYFNLT